jgi:hypothetical protein
MAKTSNIQTGTRARDLLSVASLPEARRADQPLFFSPQLATLAKDDFYSGEKRTVLLRLEVEPSKEGSLNAGKFLMSYMDVEAKVENQVEKDLTITATMDSAKVNEKENKR